MAPILLGAPFRFPFYSSPILLVGTLWRLNLSWCYRRGSNKIEANLRRLIFCIEFPTWRPYFIWGLPNYIDSKHRFWLRPLYFAWSLTYRLKFVLILLVRVGFQFWLETALCSPFLFKAFAWSQQGLHSDWDI